jgi:hypothetical protein
MDVNGNYQALLPNGHDLLIMLSAGVRAHQPLEKAEGDVACGS